MLEKQYITVDLNIIAYFYYTYIIKRFLFICYLRSLRPPFLYPPRPRELVFGVTVVFVVESPEYLADPPGSPEVLLLFPPLLLLLLFPLFVVVELPDVPLVGVVELL